MERKRPITRFVPIPDRGQRWRIIDRKDGQRSVIMTFTAARHMCIGLNEMQDRGHFIRHAKHGLEFKTPRISRKVPKYD